MVPVSIDPSLGGRPANTWTRAVQGAEGLSVAIGTQSRDLILPEGLGKLLRCDIWSSLEGTEREEGQKVSARLSWLLAPEELCFQLL